MEKLKLQIQADATKASSALDKAVDSLTNMSKAVEKIRKASKLTELANGLSALANVGKLKVTATDVKNVGALGDAIERFSGVQVERLGELASGLDKLSSVEKFNLNKSAATTIESLGEAIKGIDSNVAKNAVVLSNALRVLSDVPQVKIGNIGNQIIKLREGLSGLDGNLVKNAEKLRDILKPLQDIPKSNIGSYLNPLARLPDVLLGLNQLDHTNVDKMTESVERLLKALKPLSNLQKSGGGGSRFYGGGGGSGYGGILGFLNSAKSSFIGARLIVHQFAKSMGEIVNRSNAYVENLNLFTVAMGKFAGQAMEYSKAVNQALGIDISYWIRDWGMFKQILSSFGVAEDAAYKMSKVLTQISYDAASFFNLPFEQSVQKFQSGLAGQVKPLLRIGYALDVATLQQVAMKHGIEGSVQAMSQAEKAYIRYLAIIEQSHSVFGDLSRTLMTPANAMRVLKAQIEELKRAFANVFIPILTEVLPYLIAVAKVITHIINLLGKIFGFELPKIDYSDMSEPLVGAADAAGDLGDNINKAGKEAKKFKNFLLGFDEMFVIPSVADAAKGADGAGGVGGGGLGDMPGLDFDYDFLGKGMPKVDKLFKDIMAALQPIIDFFKRHVPYLKGLWEGLKTILAGTLIMDALKRLLKWLGFLTPRLEEILDGVVLLAGGFVVAFKTASEASRAFYQGEIDALQAFTNVALGMITGWLLTFAGAMKITGGDLGLSAILATAITIGATIAGWYDGLIESRKLDILKRHFGDIELSAEQIQILVNQFMNTPLHKELRFAFSMREDVEHELESLNSYLEALDFDLARIELGLHVDKDVFQEDAANVIQSMQSVIDKHQLYVGFSLKRGLGDYAETLGGKETIQWSTDYWGSLKTEAENLGKELNSLIEQHFIDGEWDSGTAEEKANQIIEELNVINEKISQYYQGVELEKLRLKMGNIDFGDISLESLSEAYTKFMEDSQDYLDEVQNRYALDIKQLNIRFDEDPTFTKQEFERQKAIIQTKYLSDKWEAQKEFTLKLAATLDPSLETELTSLGDKLQEKLNKITDIPAETLEKLDLEYEIDDFLGYFRQGLIGKSSPELKRASVSIWNAFGESMYEESNRIASEALEYGVAIPTSIFEGMNDAAVYGAIADNTKAMHYRYGQELFESASFRNLLSSGRIKGGEVTNEMLLGMLSTLPTMWHKLDTDFKQELINFFADAGIEAPEQFVNNFLSQSENVTAAAKQIADDATSTLRTVLLDADGNVTQTATEAVESVALALLQGKEPVDTNSKELAALIQDNFGEYYGYIYDDTESFMQFMAEYLSDPEGTISRAVHGTGSEAAQTWVNLMIHDPDSLVHKTAETMDLIDQEIENANIGSSLEGQANTLKTRLGAIFGTFGETVGNLLDNLKQGFDNLIGKKQEFETGRSSPPPPKRNGIWNKGVGALQDIASGKIFQYASGGFPDKGSLFIAGESGAEFVGNIGGQTGVANTQQIEAGVAQGVYEGLIKALSGKDGSNASDERITREDLAELLLAHGEGICQAIYDQTGVELKLDNEVLGRAVRKQARELEYVRG